MESENRRESAENFQTALSPPGNPWPGAQLRPKRELAADIAQPDTLP